MGGSADGWGRFCRWLGEGIGGLIGTEEQRIRLQFKRGKPAAEVLAADEDASPRRQELLCHVGTPLAKCTKECRKWEFRFAALNWAEETAFALPGGFIYVTTPLMDLCGSDQDELAFVLAHEIGHVVRWHAEESPLVSFLLRVGSKAAIGGLVGICAEGSNALLEKQYSQELELDADEFAVGLMKRAGCDATAAIRLLERLPGGSSPLGVYFSSHPPRELRVERIRRLLE